MLNLVSDPHGEIFYPLKAVRFTSVNTLSIHIRDNFGADTTRIHYIGLFGDFTPAPRREVVIANYEVTPNISDHKCDSFNSQSHFVE